MKKIKTFFRVIWAAYFSKKLFPAFVSWELTNRCNLSCGYCCFSKGVDAEKDLDSETLVLIVDRLKREGCHSVSLTGGECLLHKDILKIVKLIKEAGLILKVSTNGIEFDKIQELFPFVDYFAISLDGVKEDHDAFRGANCFDQVDKTIKFLKEKKKKIYIQTTLCGQSTESIEKLLQYGKEMGLPILFQPMVSLNGVNNFSKVDHYIESLQTAVSFLLRSDRLYQNIILNSRSGLQHFFNFPNDKGLFCTAGKFTFRINSRGYISPCARVPGHYLPWNELEPTTHLPAPSCKQCWCAGQVELNLLFSFCVETWMRVITRRVL